MNKINVNDVLGKINDENVNNVLKERQLVIIGSKIGQGPESSDFLIWDGNNFANVSEVCDNFKSLSIQELKKLIDKGYDTSINTYNAWFN